MKRLLAVTLCLLQASCTVHRTMRTGFYAPKPAGAPPAERPRVALSISPQVRSAAADPWSPFITAFVATDPAFSEALRSALGTAFEVAAEGAAGVDFVVTVSTGFPGEVGLAFGDPGSRLPLRTYRKPGVAWELDSRIMDVLPFLLMVGLLVVPFVQVPVGNAGRRQVERELAAALDALMDEIRRDAALFAYPALRDRVEADLRRAERAATVGDAAGALAGFERAYRDAPAGSGLQRSARQRGLKALGALDAAPPVPEEAVRLAAHARAILKRGEGEDAYEAAIAKMREALALAPWWADAYYNLGLMLETAKRPAEAIESLKLYLAAAPRSDDAAAVRDKVYELEVALERPSEAEPNEPRAPESPAR